MSTRSWVARKLVDGSYLGIYIHSDGYPAWNGRILLENYRDEAKVEALLDLGWVSILRQEIGEKHPFLFDIFDPDNQEALKKGWTMAYHRDRGDEWDHVKPLFSANLHALLDTADQHNALWVYVWTDGAWHYCRAPRHHALLPTTYPELALLTPEVVAQDLAMQG